MSIEIECLRRWLNEIADRTVELEEKVQELETKTASDLSHHVAESETIEDQNCLWLAKDKRGGRMYVYLKEPIEQYCETFAADDEDENCYQIDPDLFPQVTYENSPQKLILESSISKTETVDKAGQDAFKELRALIDDLENRYDREVSAWSFNEILTVIREVIGE